MKNRIQFVILLLVAVATILTACGIKPATSNKIVPDSLQTIEGAAEDIIDFASSGNWEKINADVASIADAWQTYQQQARKDGAPQSTQDTLTAAIAELQVASATKDAAATMQSANDLSAVVVELFDIYNPKIPADIGRLDVWERQIVLDITADNYDAATISLSKVKTVWENVKSSVLEQNGKDVAALFEASIATQENTLKAKNSAALINEAKNGLEIVDALEQLY